MKKAIRIAGAVLGLGFLLAQLARPAKTNPASDPGISVFAKLETPPATAETLKRACGDCHSNETRWPWYTNIAPVSWWTIDHVNHGRSHMNFSEWGKLPPKDAAELLEDICREIESGEMPLPSYQRMHSEARLTLADRKNICLWTVDQANKLGGKAEHEKHE